MCTHLEDANLPHSSVGPLNGSINSTHFCCIACFLDKARSATAASTCCVVDVCMAVLVLHKLVAWSLHVVLLTNFFPLFQQTCLLVCLKSAELLQRASVSWSGISSCIMCCQEGLSIIAFCVKSKSLEMVMACGGTLSELFAATWVTFAQRSRCWPCSKSGRKQRRKKGRQQWRKTLVKDGRRCARTATGGAAE